MFLKTMTFAVAFGMAATVASAASVSLFSGSANELTNVTDAADDALASDTIQYFLEAENQTFTTTQNVNLDDEVPIAAGTEMNSYIIFLNTVSDSLVETYAGFEFDGDVLGIIYYDNLLNRSGSRFGAIGSGQGRALDLGRRQFMRRGNLFDRRVERHVQERLDVHHQAPDVAGQPAGRDHAPGRHFPPSPRDFPPPVAMTGPKRVAQRGSRATRQPSS